MGVSSLFPSLVSFFLLLFLLLLLFSLGRSVATAGFLGEDRHGQSECQDGAEKVLSRSFVRSG